MLSIVRDRVPGPAGRLRIACAAAALLFALPAAPSSIPTCPRPSLKFPIYSSIKRAAVPSTATPYDFVAFRSKYLNELIALGRGFNFDVGAAIARIQEAEAQVRIAEQQLIPTITTSGTGASQSLAPGRGRTTTVTAALSGSYTLDIWGQYRSLLFAAKADEWNASFAAALTTITTDASIATTYFQSVGALEQIEIAKRNLAAAQRILKAIKDQFAQGTTSGLDVAQQETLVANVAVTIPPLERNLQQYKYALAVLVGQAPEFFRYKGEKLFSVAVPVIPSGLPSDLLCRRPDIASAEAQLSAAKFNVSSARAAMFPSIQLTGQGGFQSAALASLFQPQSAFYNMAAGIVQPITNEYGLQAQLDLQKATYGELLQTYRKTIFSAFQNVESTLIAYKKDAQQERLQYEAVTSARRAFELSEQQLKVGDHRRDDFAPGPANLVHVGDCLRSDQANAPSGCGFPLSGFGWRVV